MSMALWLALLTAVQDPPDDAGVLPSLRYLARHQAADGSWGRRPPACTCPAEPAPPPGPAEEAALLERAAALAAALDDEDPGRRAEAQAELVRLGPAAGPALRAALERGSPELRGRAGDILRRIAAGTTATDVELTAWALLTFLGAGYSHLSKDETDGLRIGDVVARGLAWLAARQDARGAVGEPASSAHATAALALSEAYGLTASQRYQEPSQKAINVLAASPAKDDRTLVWQVMALKSAEVSGLEFHRDAYATRLAELRARRDAAGDDPFLQAGDTAARIFIEKRREGVDLGAMPQALPARLEAETTYLTSIALFQYDGPGGNVWKGFQDRRNAWLVPRQVRTRGACERGAWPATGTGARLKVTVFSALMLEVYYAYHVIR